MRIIILATTLFLIANQLFGQPASSTTTDGSSYDMATNSTLGLHNFGLTKPKSYDEVDGSPFLTDDFVLSSGMMSGGNVLDSIELKYDLHTHTFLAKLEDGTVITVDDKQFREFRMDIDGEEVIFKRVDPEFPNIFYEIIFQNKDMTIYKSQDVGLVKGEDQGISKSNDRFFTKEKYMIRKGKDIERTKLKKKTLWKHFNKKQREILDAHLKNNKMKLKKDRDYRKLFEILQGFA